MSGINLQSNKEALLSARVRKRMRDLGIDNYRSYLRHATGDESGGEIVRLIDAVSTNVTHFFREPDHFDFLKKVIKGWLSLGQKRFRIWSAASSSGEEPYSIAMSMMEIIGKDESDVKILATDISTEILAQARLGIYSREKIKSISRQLKLNYFQKVSGANGDYFQVMDSLKQIATFARLNLSKPPFPMKGPFDLIFCRNVMIYFDNPTRTKLVKEIHRLLKPKGYLLTGHTESLTGIKTEFKCISPSVYVK